MLVKAIAKESGLNFIFVQGPTLLSRYIGEGEKGLRQAFRFARQSAPSILCLDGIESLFPNRKPFERDAVAERLISQFSSEMSGILDMRGVTVIGTALSPDAIDSRVIGAGRFEIQVALPEPDESERVELLQGHTRRKPVSSCVDLASIAVKTPGLNGAELENLCRVAAEEALKAQVGSGKREALAEIGPDHFDEALRRLLKESV